MFKILKEKDFHKEVTPGQITVQMWDRVNDFQTREDSRKLLPRCPFLERRGGIRSLKTREEHAQSAEAVCGEATTSIHTHLRAPSCGAEAGKPNTASWPSWNWVLGVN